MKSEGKTAYGFALTTSNLRYATASVVQESKTLHSWQGLASQILEETCVGCHSARSVASVQSWRFISCTLGACHDPVMENLLSVHTLVLPCSQQIINREEVEASDQGKH